MTLSRILSLPAIIAFCTAVAIPLRASGVAPQQAALGLALLAALIVVLKSPETRQELAALLKSRYGLLGAGVVITWGISTVFSFAPMGSLQIGGRSILFVMAAVIIWATLRSHPATHPLTCKTLIIFALFATSAATLASVGISPGYWVLKFKYDMPPNTVDPFKAYAVAAMCLTPIVVWAGRYLGGRWIWAGYAFAPLSLTFSVVTYNRSAIVGFMAMSIVGIAAYAITKQKNIKHYLALGAMVIASVLIWIRSHEIWREEYYSGPWAPIWLIDSHRQYIWQFALERFLDHPWFGNGIDQLSRLPGADAYVAALGTGAHLIPSHPHSWVLELLAETGVVGFFAVLALLATIVWSLLTNYLTTKDGSRLALLVLFAGFWSSALFNFSIWAVWWQLTLFVLFALVMACSTRKSP